MDATEIHQDRGSLAAPVSAKVYEGVAARTHKPGDALRYDSGDEYRDSSELDKVVAQLPGKPLLLLHPVDGLLRDGAQGRVIGHVVSARRDGDQAVVQVLVTDAEGEAAIADGTHELSMGYACGLDANRYQRGTILDHLAVVPRARCGAQCSLRTDCAGCALAQTTPRTGTTDAGTCKCHTARQTDSVENEDGSLNAAERKAIPSDRFAVPGRKALPLEDEGHVKDAMARYSQEHFQGPAERKAAFHHIVARAHELGINASHFETEHSGRLDNEDQMEKQLEDAKAEIVALKSRADAAEKARDAEKARADAADKSREAAELAAREALKDANAEKARADASDTAVKALEEKAKAHTDAAIDARVTQRVEVLAAVAKVLPASDKDGNAIDYSKSVDLDLMKQIARHVDGDDAVLDTDSDDAVRVSFRGALKRHTKARISHADTRVAIAQMRKDGATAVANQHNDTEDAAFRAMTSDMQRPRGRKN